MKGLYDSSIFSCLFIYYLSDLSIVNPQVKHGVPYAQLCLSFLNQSQFRLFFSKRPVGQIEIMTLQTG